MDAAAGLANEHIVVALVGDGSHRRELELRAIRLGLTNLKFVPLQNDFPATLAAADVLVLVQRGRVIDSVAPSKLLAYIASGKPVVAAVNDLSEAGRVVHMTGCGIVVPPEDPTRLACAIRDLSRNLGLRARLGRRGRQYAEERFSKVYILGYWDSFIADVTVQAKAATST